MPRARVIRAERKEDSKNYPLRKHTKHVENGPHAWKNISPLEWQRIVGIYAKHGGLIGPVALELGWTEQRIQRLWKVGVPVRGFPPIRLLLGMEELGEVREARAKIEAELPPSTPIVSKTPGAQAEEVAQKAVVIHEAENRRIKALIKRDEDIATRRKDALQARSEEAMMVSINRRNALALNGVTHQVLKGAMMLSERLQAQLEQEAKSGKMDAAQTLALIRSAASVARFNSEATLIAVKAERAVLGDPLDADGSTDPAGDGSLDAAVTWIERAVSAVNRARERGVLTSGEPSKPSDDE